MYSEPLNYITQTKTDSFLHAILSTVSEGASTCQVKPGNQQIVEVFTFSCKYFLFFECFMFCLKKLSLLFYFD